VRANAIIAGVNKAGTTSLFVSLSSHPQVAPAAVKETRYFLPARWGRELEPVSVYEECFADAGQQPVRLEATPSYFYGGSAVIDAMQRVCGDDLRVMVVLREPVARCWSFFEYQKARLRIPEDMTLEAYLAHADALTDADFRDPENERWFAFRGGCYADWLPDWTGGFGDRFSVVWFEELMNDPATVLTDVATFLSIDPEAYPTTELASENRTTGYKRAGLQKVALGFNDTFERFLRRHYGLKEKLRSAYYRFNGSKAKARIPDDMKAKLTERYVEPNARLHAQLVETGVAPPDWLRKEQSSV
jgi:hypothetical protein